MKATLSYNLNDPDDRMAHLRAVKSLDMASALFEITQNLRKKVIRKFEDDDKEYDKWYESLDKFPDETRVYIEDKEVIYLMDDNYIEEKCYG